MNDVLYECENETISALHEGKYQYLMQCRHLLPYWPTTDALITLGVAILEADEECTRI